MRMQVVPTMLVSAIAAYFKHKAVASIVILACWDSFSKIKFNREIPNYGFRTTFICDPSKLDIKHPYALQGVLTFVHDEGNLFSKIKSEHFNDRYVWLLVGPEIPDLDAVRYDAEMVLLREDIKNNNQIQTSEIYLEDVLVHPKDGPSTHPWGYWSRGTGLVVMYEHQRINRRRDLKGYVLKIATPVGLYSDKWYNGTFDEYIVDETLTKLDSGIRCSHAGSSLIADLVNASKITITTEAWSSTTSNKSMVVMLKQGRADLSGAILRVLHSRLEIVDFIMPIWPFHVGFTYLAERESSSNMFVEPFTPNVWWSCLVILIILAVAQRATARSLEEKNDAFCAVIATFLQQDASAVPQGISGRWTFLVLSVCAMLVHAYYTSAIVSALMSAGSGGPQTLRALGDSKYSIASEDFDYMRYLFFDVETNWPDLEYLKRKKKTSNFYFELERGAELIQRTSTAFHTEYNQLFPYLKTFSDEQICRLQHVDTVSEVMTWLTTSPEGQFSNIFRSSGAWLNEVGLGKRLYTRLRAQRPECRAQMLAERVKIGDISQLLGLTAFGAVLAVTLLVVEIFIAKWKKKVQGLRQRDEFVDSE